MKNYHKIQEEYQNKKEEYQMPEDFLEDQDVSEIDKSNLDNESQIKQQNMIQQCRSDMTQKRKRSCPTNYANQKLTNLVQQNIIIQPEISIIKKANLLIESINRIIDPNDILIGEDINNLLELKGKDQQELKRSIQNIYVLLKEGFHNEMKSSLKVIESSFSPDWYEIHVELDIGQDIVLNNQTIWKQRIVEKTMITQNYYEAQFIGYFKIFKEICVTLLGLPADSSISLSQFIQKFDSKLIEKQKSQSQPCIPTQRKDHQNQINEIEFSQKIKQDRDDKFFNRTRAKYNLKKQGLHEKIFNELPKNYKEDQILSERQDNKYSKMLRKYRDENIEK